MAIPEHGTSSSGSLLHPDLSVSSHDQAASSMSKLSSDNSFQLETDPEPAMANSQPRRTWNKRLLRGAAGQNPKTAERLRRIVVYWRGPRPKVDLPDPAPLLDIHYKIKGQTVFIPLEGRLTRLVRPLTRPWIFWLCAVAYIIGFAFFARAQAFLTPPSSFLGCTSTWWSANNGCGFDGKLCAPFDNTTFEYRCPAQCDYVILQNPRTVGNEEIAFKPLIVGGGDPDVTYRGDSFICAAAIQADMISQSKGGCGSVSLIGNFTNFLPYTANGLSSIGFPSVFPLSFRFSKSTSLTHCEDMRMEALAFNVLITCILFLVLRPKSIVLYWSLVCIGFWHIVLFSQPRGSPPPLSTAFGTFLPVLFIAYAFWRLAFRFTLPAFKKATIEATIWYLGPFWVGVLDNITTSKIPIGRLTSSDLAKRSGAITALVIIIIIITIIVLNQIRVIRKTGWLPHYAGWYIAGGLVTLVIALLPGLQLRLHHYILSMVLLPGTGFPTRLSAIYQGYLLGIFLNGAAAFGLDSILQTTSELRQDAPLGSDLPAFLTTAATFNASIPLINQTISWAALPDGWDGYSLLVDDVERYVGTALNVTLAAFASGIPHFFRLALTSGAQTGDFTNPAVLWPNGTWVDPLPGASY